MPLQGLSLFGFLERDAAFAYLRAVAHVPDKSDAALGGLWEQARERLGDTRGTPGICAVRDLPAEAGPYLNGVQTNPRFASTVRGLPWAFKAVEIAPLIAYQFHVCTDQHRGAEATLEEALPRCLPQQLDPITFNYRMVPMPGGGQLFIQSEDLNLVAILDEAGYLGGDGGRHYQFGGVPFGPASPFVQVVRFDGRCFLRNGFHRCYQLAARGMTHVPCILLESPVFEAIGARGQGATFDRDQLLSANPPTCGHFADGRAYDLELRRAARVVRVSWEMGQTWLD